MKVPSFRLFSIMTNRYHCLFLFPKETGYYHLFSRANSFRADEGPCFHFHILHVITVRIRRDFYLPLVVSTAHNALLHRNVSEQW